MAGRQGADLQAGLDQVAKQINDQLAQSQAPVGDAAIASTSIAGDSRGGPSSTLVPAAAPRWTTVLFFMSPWIIGFSVFIVYPMMSSLYFSFTHYDLLGSPSWVGFANYRYMFAEDIVFWKAIKNTVWFIVVAVPLQIVFASSRRPC